MKKRPGYSPEVRERAVRMVFTGEHEHSSRWAAIQSIGSKVGCTPETLRKAAAFFAQAELERKPK